MEPVVWFADLKRTDTDIAGGKGANLGELVSGGFPVPPGFVVTANAYLASMEAAHVRNDLRGDPTEPAGHPEEAAAKATELQVLVRKAGLHPEVHEALTAAYTELGRRIGVTAPRVAVRSSATSEDAADTSFAGMNRTFTNVEGIEAVGAAVVEAWASLFAERVLVYRGAHRVTAEPAIAVVVQAMVPAATSGVAFTADPVTGDRSRIVIEAAFGQGEVVVGGRVEPDTYTVAKSPLQIVDERIGTKSHKIVAGVDGDVRIDLSREEGAQRVLRPAAVLDVARLALNVEAHYGEPMDIEWCFDDPGSLAIVQARPITALASAPPAPATSTGAVLLRGLGASPGVASGVARVLDRPDEGGALLAGEVLVAPMTNPDWLPTLRRAAAIVTDGGGMTCHAAIVSRELGVPCVVGARTATTALHTGDLITVDGAAGTVTAGRQAPVAAARARTEAPIERTPPPATGTKLYVNLALASNAARAAALDVDGVGLVRAEFMLTEALQGRHPRQV
ncbi:MAG TPA: PEP/pyruvate-binding domain-containing protein, partial [Acidimicrobiales bacterium]